MEKLYIDENINVSTNFNAENLLKINNDTKYYNSEEEGVHKVSNERWGLAQKFERKTWMENLYMNDDRNFEHYTRFEDLNSISDKKTDITSIIELGCGPFTNVRLFREFTGIQKLTLVDPLLNDYKNHPNCYYKDGNLNSVITELINSPIENLQVEYKYKAVVMINVLEHCFDIDLIFDKILNLLDTDGVFIFSDVYFSDVFSLVSNIYDAGHPLRLSEKKLNYFLENFNPIFDRRFEKLYGQEWRKDIYFIGSLKK
jgi:SAM-dependent methyltransferase